LSRTAQESPRIAPEVMARYEAVIGLEVHAQLKTRTKAFCGCSTRFGDPPNSNVCPVCLGLPGALPVLNRRAVELAVQASLALHSKIHERSRFARKNYFYPDLPKGYQISMYELPLATGGWLGPEHAALTYKRVGGGLVVQDRDATAAGEVARFSFKKRYLAASCESSTWPRCPTSTEVSYGVWPSPTLSTQSAYAGSPA